MAEVARLPTIDAQVAGVSAFEVAEVARLAWMANSRGRRLRFTNVLAWDRSQATIRLGLSYTGRYDDLSVSNRALSDQEVQTLYGLSAGVLSLYR